MPIADAMTDKVVEHYAEWQEGNGTLYAPGLEKDECLAHLFGDNLRTYCLQDNLALAAFGTILMLQSDKQTGAYISNVFVVPSKRGKGYGVEMMTRLEGEASGHQADAVTLHSETENIDFYTQLGCYPLRTIDSDLHVLAKKIA